MWSGSVQPTFVKIAAYVHVHVSKSCFLGYTYNFVAHIVPVLAHFVTTLAAALMIRILSTEARCGNEASTLESVEGACNKT